MPISPEKWIDLLKLYGPMALFVFMVFVLLRRALITKDLTGGQRKIQIAAFTLVWLSIFVLAGMIVVAWWRINFPSEFVVSGIIHHLKDPEIITTDEPFYLHRRRVAARDFEYDWRFISQKPFFGKAEVILQKKPSDSAILKYELPIRETFYQGTVEIDYDRRNDHMILSHGPEKEEIAPVTENVPGESAKIGNGLPENFDQTVVFASAPQKVNPEELAQALDADDPLLRQQARRDLIALGAGAIPVVEQVLTDRSSSRRLRLGILSTLRELSPEAKGMLHEPARCTISEATKDSDSTLRAEAAAVIAAGVSIPAKCPTTPQAVGPASAECVSGKVGNEELRLFRIGQKDIPVYLMQVSQGRIVFGRFGKPPDIADIIVITKPDWSTIVAKAGLSISRVKRGYLKQELGLRLKRDSMRAALADAGPQAYVERKIDNGTSFPVTVDGNSYTIEVKTHYIGRFAEIAVCPGV